MALTAQQQEVLAAAPIRGLYVTGLGNVPGRWMYLIGERSVTRQVNSLIAAGLMKTDAVPYGARGKYMHPERLDAIATAAQR